ncbi:hypothetical protein [Streptomyces palmae]|uniref:hypothetical protein n=1 Tax=Streptomyces palmae TaxID=1701085 RepID=UPI0014329711|nr:hypothetical protein [Streptomyces palmae]
MGSVCLAAGRNVLLEPGTTHTISLNAAPADGTPVYALVPADIAFEVTTREV